MDLKEAIEHCLEKVEELKHCNKECSNEHLQLAQWLKELKEIKEVNDRELITILKNGKDFELLKDFCFYSLELKEFEKDLNVYYHTNDKAEVFIKVPKGFRTDFGSIPQLFQSFLSPIGKPTKAYVVHDYLCTLANLGAIERKVADKVFKRALKALGCGRFKTYLLYFSVRAFSLTIVPIRKLF